MNAPLTMVIVSFTAVCALLALYHIERVRGRRFFSYVREHLDYKVLKVRHLILRIIRALRSDVARQIAHYFVHTALGSILAFLTRLEAAVRTLMRSNRMIARKSERERANRNKLEAVALHKMEIALSEEEKRRHKEAMLNGGSY